MKKLHWEIKINAPREKVFKTIFNPELYPIWAGVFMPGSYYKGLWQKGETLRFLVDDENGKPSGMLTRVVDYREPEFISLQHIGIVIEGEDVTEGEEVESMTPAFENYTLKTEGDGTNFLVDQDVALQYEETFSESWPKALEKLKMLCEKD